MDRHLQDLIPPQPYAASFDPDNAIEVLHENTKWFRRTFKGQLRSIVRYLSNPGYIARGASGYHEFLNCPVVTLPAPAPVESSLGEALANRRSGYGLTGQLTSEQLSTLLHHAVRVNKRATSTVAPSVEMTFRPYPSPGGLYPTEIYLYVNKVDGIAPCIAHYDARTHTLRVLAAQDGRAFEQVEIPSGGQFSSAPIVMVFTTVPQRVTAKYGGRGYRMGLLEVGHASQNACLVASALGIGALVYGSYFDDELAAALNTDGVTETVASVILFGTPSK
jgi:SagB-type dehydrogenase family enzyme